MVKSQQRPRDAAQAAYFARPFHDFLAEHGLTVLEPLLVLAQTAQGYGIMENIPTLYGLWWASPTMVRRSPKRSSARLGTSPNSR